MRASRSVVAALCMVFLAGCGVYHRVTATETKQVYYTKNLDESTSGSMKFTDAKTGQQVILPSASVERISALEFERGVGK